MDTQHVVHPFGPLYSPESQILILGSFPSVKSREAMFFYGHPQNRFWPLISNILDEPLPISIAEKKGIILRHHLALWDVISSCDIIGSSDASVRNAEANDFSAILSEANICRIICNGKLSGSLYHQLAEEKTGIKALVLPSTSPANASFRLSDLIRYWRPALNMSDIPESKQLPR